MTRSGGEGSAPGGGAGALPFGEVVDRSLTLLGRRGRISHTALGLEFALDDATLAALREELVAVLGVADDDGRVLVARGGGAAEHERAPAADEPPPAPVGRVTALLCDLVETPELASLDAQARSAVAARVHAICGEVGTRLRGRVQPWICDGVAIFFGHPAARADDALRAVRCGWEILRTLEAACARRSGSGSRPTPQATAPTPTATRRGSRSTSSGAARPTA